MRAASGVLVLVLLGNAAAAPAPPPARPSAARRAVPRPAPPPVRPAPPPVSWYERALAEYSALHWTEAVAAFDEFRKQHPGDPRDRDASFFIAIALAKNATDFARMVTEWQHWLALSAADDPVRPVVEANLAESLMALGRIDDAIAHYRRSDQLAPKNPLTLFGLAVALDRDEQQPEARRVMQRALALDPTLASLSAPEVFFIPMGDVHDYYGLGYEVAGKRADAIREYQAFIAKLPRSRYLAVARAHLAKLQMADATPI